MRILWLYLAKIHFLNTCNRIEVIILHTAKKLTSLYLYHTILLTAYLMLVFDVPLKVNFLPESLPTLVTLVLPDVQVNVLVALQIAAGGSHIVTVFTLVIPRT